MYWEFAAVLFAASATILFVAGGAARPEEVLASVLSKRLFDAVAYGKNEKISLAS